MGNETKYCIWCGTPYADENNLCLKCGRQPSPKENLLIDYLVTHTKSTLKSNTNNSLYDAVKNWALSHLYGVVLGVTVVTAAVTVSAANTEKHIKNVSRRPSQITVNYEENSDDEPNSTEPYIVTDRDKEEIAHVIDVLYSDAIGNCGGTLNSRITSLWVPESLSPNQIHHIFKDRWGDDLYTLEERLSSTIEFDGTVYGDISTTTAKKLKDQGYPVAFIGVDMTIYTTAEYPHHPNYYITMVKINGDWLILEELNTHSRWADVKDIWIDQ